MGGKRKKTKWKKLAIGTQSNVGTKHDCARDQNEANAELPSELNNTTADEEDHGNPDADFSNTSLDDNTIPENLVDGCYVNGLWMPLDYETVIAYHPLYAPYSVLPSVWSWSDDFNYPRTAYDPQKSTESYSKRRYTSPYWKESYLPYTNETTDHFVPYLYPGYVFGPSVYSVPTAEFPYQGIRKKKRKNRSRFVFHEIRQIEPGIDAISTPSCDVIRYDLPSGGGNRKQKTVLGMNEVDNDKKYTNNNTENLNLKEHLKSENIFKESEDESPENSKQTNGGFDPTGVVPDLVTSADCYNSTTVKCIADETEKMEGAVKTISRFKVYPCTDDPLQNKGVETDPKASPQHHQHLTSSDILLRETELELTKINQKAFQPNQAIYKLAYDESVTDEESVSSEHEEPAPETKEPPPENAQDNVPIDLREHPSNRMEIEVHEMDTSSDAGSEDVEIFGHRYETHAPPEKHLYVNKLSLATELLRTQENLPYDSEFKRLVDDEDLLPTVEFRENKHRISRADSGVQSEESGDEIIHEIKEPIIQQEEMWSSAEGRHYRRQLPSRIPYLSSSSRGAPNFPCLCCIIM